MSRVMFISDLHLWHRGALRWAKDYRKGENVEEHNSWLLTKISQAVTKRDTLYILGDLMMPLAEDGAELSVLNCIPCRKILVRGNHDDRFNASELLEVFDDVLGVALYKNHWLSHAPIHPNELRGKGNIHGHVHMNSIMDEYEGVDEYDKRYINVCVEALAGEPINYQDIANGNYQNIRRC